MLDRTPLGWLGSKTSTQTKQLVLIFWLIQSLLDIGLKFYIIAFWPDLQLSGQGHRVAMSLNNDHWSKDLFFASPILHIDPEIVMEVCSYDGWTIAVELSFPLVDLFANYTHHSKLFACVCGGRGCGVGVAVREKRGLFSSQVCFSIHLWRFDFCKGVSNKPCLLFLIWEEVGVGMGCGGVR